MPKTEDKFKTVNRKGQYAGASTVIRKDSKAGRDFNKYQTDTIKQYQEEGEPSDPGYETASSKNRIRRKAADSSAATFVGVDAAVNAGSAKRDRERSKYGKK
jgi:hypothetical protein